MSTAKKRILLGIVIFCVVLLIGAAFFLLKSQVSSDKQAIVDFSAGTKLFWNGVELEEHPEKLLTNPIWDVEDTPGWEIEEIPSFEQGSGLSTLALAPLNPHTLNDEEKITPETKVGVFWTLRDQDYTYVADGKKVKEIHFDGLDQSYLAEYMQNGLILQFPEPGTYSMKYSVVDSDGIKKSGFDYFEFTVES